MNLASRVFLILILIAAAAGAQSISGVVRDDSGAAIPGVTVTATPAADGGAPVIGITGGEGEFHFTNLRPGVYALETSLDGFQTMKKEVRLVTGQTIEVAFKLVPAFGETLEVTAKAAEVGEVAILESRRQAPVISDSISAEEIRKSPDSNAASVVERLTGVTLLSDKYVYVRGLGERYSGTTLNGATLPTTETEKRVVPLDLFPAKLLETVNVVKTYTPDKPGDFGSGVVEMTTTQFPSSATMKLTVGTAYSSNATGNPFIRYAGGLDRFGNGGQKLPSGIPQDFLKRRSILDPSGFTPAELETFGEALIGDWTGNQLNSASLSTDLALTYGNTFGRVGVVVSAVSNHSYNNVEEQQRFFGLDVDDKLVAFNDYDLSLDREQANAGFVGNVSFRLNDANRIFLNSVLTRDAASDDRVQSGLQTASGGDIRDYRVRYQLEEIFSTRLRGEHNLGGPGLGSLVQWSLAKSTASNDSDLRENIYRESDPGVFALQTGFAESGKMEFFNLSDDIAQGALSYEIFLSAPRWSGSVKGGVDRQRRTRDFGARRFRFTTATTLGIDLTKTPDEIFTAENIGPNGFEVREITGVNDAYDAEHTIDAAYLMTDLTRGRWRVIGGARYETSDQRVTTFNPFDTAKGVDAINQTNNVLPSVNVVYAMQPQTNLRLGYGRSVNRPEFRELSPFTFIEVAGGRSVAGNPDLEQAIIDALDVRWETFPRAGEVVAASAFYKRIDKPIEKIVQPTTDFRQSFINADAATLWGVELELRRSLEPLLPSLHNWSVNFNYANIHSNVDVGEHQFSVVTNHERPLEGQSDQTANVALQFYEPRWGTMVRLLAAYNGERLTEVGAFGLPDIYEAASTSLDVVFSQSLGPLAKGLEIKLAGTNLLDDKRQFTQGDQIQRSFDPGRKVSFSLSYSPF